MTQQTTLEYSKEQNEAIGLITEWYNYNEEKPFILGGYAGTGKTTLVSTIQRIFPRMVKIAYISYTGKASHVLRVKLKSTNSLRPVDYCGTIHSLIYKPKVEESSGNIISWDLKTKDEVEYDLLVVDEASMIGSDIYKDLKSYEIPILAVGDCFQLPPIEGTLNLMENPDFMLREIHRQSEGNPIIKLSMDIRSNGVIPPGMYGEKVAKVVGSKNKAVNNFLRNTNNFDTTLLLCGFNATRVKMNNYIRENLLKRTTSDPQKGDRVVCLKNNHFAMDTVIYNGSCGRIRYISDHGCYYEIEVVIDETPEVYHGPIDKTCFGNSSPEMNPTKVNRAVISASSLNVYAAKLDYFDYGYCLSVHKAQGSQANRVMVLEERSSYWDDEYWARWLYTAITRAQNQLLIVAR